MSLFNNISKYVSLTEDEKEIVASAFSELTAKRKDILIRQDEPCSYLYFIVSGLLRAFSYNKEGKEVTVMFAKKDWWITDMNSFVNKRNATVAIEAVEDSVLLMITQAEMESLYSRVPSFDQLWRILFQNAYCREQQRVFEQLTLKASERYLKFVESYPDVIQSITQRQLASYLGVTPEFLSSMKSSLNLD